jgi:DNA-binding transcriptional LysR family regulator
MLERTLASAEAVRRRAQEFQRKEVPPLKNGLAPSISASLVLDPIAETAKFVPGLHVELREGAAGKLVDLLLEGEINAAMVGDVQDMPDRIDDWSLFEERYVAVLAPTHQLANRPSIGIDDLRETVLLERAECDVAPKIQRLYFPEEPPHLGNCSGHDLHLQHMAAAGFGVILAPEHNQEGKVFCHDIQDIRRHRGSSRYLHKLAGARANCSRKNCRPRKVRRW